MRPTKRRLRHSRINNVTLRLLLLSAATIAAIALTAPASASPSALVMTPHTLNFGTVTVGTYVDMRVTLTNRSTDTIFIDGWSIGVKTGDNPWADAVLGEEDTCLSLYGYHIPPGGSCSLTPVRFHPAEAGHYRGFIYVEFEVDGANGPHDSVTSTLLGRAVNP
jgi:hypothetical protein